MFARSDRKCKLIGQNYLDFVARTGRLPKYWMKKWHVLAFCGPKEDGTQYEAPAKRLSNLAKCLEMPLEEMEIAIVGYLETHRTMIGVSCVDGYWVHPAGVNLWGLAMLSFLEIEMRKEEEARMNEASGAEVKEAKGKARRTSGSPALHK